MTRAQARALHAATALVAGTGLVYGWMRYFAESDDPFSIANHPWQPHLQHAHLLAAPLLVFACGLVWPGHVWARLCAGFTLRRRTGLVLAVLLLPMIATGYLIQAASDETWRAIWIWSHGISSLAWTGTYLVHQALAWRALPVKGALERPADAVGG